MLKRIFDLILTIILIALLCIPMLLIAIFIRLRSKGPAIFWTNRVGINNV
ncbi:MAG: sugar transferase, partial [Candidatus Omnitrophota bacterium]